MTPERIFWLMHKDVTFKNKDEFFTFLKDREEFKLSNYDNPEAEVGKAIYGQPYRLKMTGTNSKLFKNKQVPV